MSRVNTALVENRYEKQTNTESTKRRKVEAWDETRLHLRPNSTSLLFCTAICFSIWTLCLNTTLKVDRDGRLLDSGNIGRLLCN